MQSAVNRNGAKGQKTSPELYDPWRVNKLLKIRVFTNIRLTVMASKDYFEK
jgi:hypothetical protein